MKKLLLAAVICAVMLQSGVVWSMEEEGTLKGTDVQLGVSSVVDPKPTAITCARESAVLSGQKVPQGLGGTSDCPPEEGPSKPLHKQIAEHFNRASMWVADAHEKIVDWGNRNIVEPVKKAVAKSADFLIGCGGESYVVRAKKLDEGIAEQKKIIMDEANKKISVEEQGYESDEDSYFSGSFDSDVEDSDDHVGGKPEVGVGVDNKPAVSQTPKVKSEQKFVKPVPKKVGGEAARTIKDKLVSNLKKAVVAVKNTFSSKDSAINRSLELRKDFVSKRDSSVKNSDREKYYNDHLKTIDKNLKSKGFDVDEEHAKVQKSIAETQGEIEETDKKIIPLVEERLKKQGIKFLSGSVIIHGHGESSTSVDYRLEGDQAIRSETIKYGSTDVEAKDKEIGDILEKYTAVATDSEKVKSLHDQLKVSKKELEALKAGKDSGVGKTLKDLADLKVKKQDLENKLKDFVPSKPD